MSHCHVSVTWGYYNRTELCGYCMVIVWLLCGADGKICGSIANFINSVFFCKKICVSQKNSYSCIIQIFFVPLQSQIVNRKLSNSISYDYYPLCAQRFGQIDNGQAPA